MDDGKGLFTPHVMFSLLVFLTNNFYRNLPNPLKAVVRRLRRGPSDDSASAQGPKLCHDDGPATHAHAIHQRVDEPRRARRHRLQPPQRVLQAYGLAHRAG